MNGPLGAKQFMMNIRKIITFTALKRSIEFVNIPQQKGPVDHTSRRQRPFGRLWGCIFNKYLSSYSILNSFPDENWIQIDIENFYFSKCIFMGLLYVNIDICMNYEFVFCFDCKGGNSKCGQWYRSSCQVQLGIVLACKEVLIKLTKEKLDYPVL